MYAHALSLGLFRWILIYWEAQSDTTAQGIWCQILYGRSGTAKPLGGFEILGSFRFETSVVSKGCFWVVPFISCYVLL